MIISERFKDLTFSFDSNDESLTVSDCDMCKTEGDRNNIVLLTNFFNDIRKRVI